MGYLFHNFFSFVVMVIIPQVINAFETILSRKAREFNISVYWLSTYFMQNLVPRKGRFEYHDVRPQNGIRNNKSAHLFEFEKIIIPIHVDDMHWILMVIRLVTECAFAIAAFKMLCCWFACIYVLCWQLFQNVRSLCL